MQIQHTKHEATPNLASFINASLNDFNQLTTALKNHSKSASQINHHLKNKLLLASESDSKSVIKQILNHFLHIVEIKGINNIVLSILTKVIGFVKILQKMQTKESLQKRNEEMSQILYSIIDIMVLMKSQFKEFDITLRIIQATFSLIDEKLLQFANYNILIRIYSVCFQCCQSNHIIQNISVSALFSLTQLIFNNTNTKDSLMILSQMLENLFNQKRFLWIKDKELNGMIWDLINVAIRSFPTDRLDQLVNQKQIMEALIRMYNISTEKAFIQSQDVQKTSIVNRSMSRDQIQKSINFKKGQFPQFIRYYKTFIYFSIHLYMKGSNELKQLILFRQNLQYFKVLYQTERNSKLYLLLQGASLLLNEHSSFLIEEEHGIILLDVFNKVSEDLEHTQHPLEFHIDKGDLYLEKLCGDFTKINDNDFVKLIKNTILRLRKNLEVENQISLQDSHVMEKSIQNSLQEENGKHYVPLKKRWERLIKIVIKIIRHLTSLNLKQGSNEQIVRKMIGELQYWFIICPTIKIKNIILEQLLMTSTMLDSRIQSIKASQCLQIGSNIIYAYYDSLDTFGLAIIIRMIAGVQVSWQEGRGFDQLEEVCTMTQKLYTQQQLVHSSESFTKTIQAFVECLNGLLADVEQPFKNDSKQSKNHHKKHIDRYLKMIDYVLGKIESILKLSSQYIQKQWNFLTGFWISFSSNKNIQIKRKILNHLLPIVIFMVKNTEVSQYSIANLYQQLAKLHSIDVSRMIIAHLKQILISLTSEDAILEVFKALSTILETKGVQNLHQQLYQLLEMIIKQSIFRIKSNEKLLKIIDCICFISKDKSQQYKVVNLIWSIADHLKILTQNHEQNENKQVWRHLFKRIIYLAETTKNGETKQSCIHAFTQIIGESISIIGQKIFASILHEYYLDVFSILMSFEKKQSQHDQISTNSSKIQINHEVAQQKKQGKTLNIDMIRIGIKNFIKITRKCLYINSKVSRDMFMEIFSRIHVQLSEKKLNTIQYLVQLNVFLQYLQEILQVEEIKQLKFHEEIHKLIAHIQQNHSFVDKTTYTWKKYSAAFEEIKVAINPN